MNKISGKISQRAAELHADTLIWDNQACFSIDITDKFFSSLDRHKACGVDIVCLNVGFDGKPWEHAAGILKKVSNTSLKKHQLFRTWAGSARDVLNLRPVGPVCIMPNQNRRKPE